MAAITISKFGFCKCKFTSASYPANWTTPIDIQEGRGVNFSFTYEWNGNTCTITNIKWRPGKILYNDDTGRSFYSCGLGRPADDDQSGTNIIDYSFVQQNQLTISFNNSNLDLTGLQNTRISTPAGINANITKTISNISTKYIVANFKYEYTSNSVTYLVEINNIKIPKTSKYEQNVVFTKAGVEELVGNLVHKTGDTMTGDLFIESTSPDIILKNKNMDTTQTTLTGNQYSTLLFQDKNSSTHNIGYIQAGQTKNTEDNEPQINPNDNNEYHSWTRICTRTTKVTDSTNVNNYFTLHAYRTGDVRVGFSHPAAWREGLGLDKPITISLGSNESASFNGSSTVKPGVTGKLKLENGGTGYDFSSIPPYAIIRATSNLQTYPYLYYQATAPGAFYAQQENGAPQFGILPQTYGGTGTNNLNNITVGTAINATKATQDGSGNVIIDTYQTKHITRVVTFSNFALDNGVWKATATVNGVTANNTIIVSPIVTEWSKWRDYGIRCTAQGSNSVTLTAEDNSVTNTSANIIILN